MSALIEVDGQQFLIKPYEWGLTNGFTSDAEGNGIGALITDIRVGFISEPPPDLAVPVDVFTSYRKPEYILDWIESGSGTQIVSEAMRRFLEPRVAGLTFTPARLQLCLDSDEPSATLSGDFVEGYWWMHCHNRVPLIDEARTEYYPHIVASEALEARNPPNKRKSWKIARVVDPLPDAPSLFQVANHRDSSIYVTTEFHQELVESGLQVYFKWVPLDATWAPPDARQISASTARLMGILNPRGRRDEPQFNLKMHKPLEF